MFDPMMPYGRLLFPICRDFYVVLLTLLVLEQILPRHMVELFPGGDVLHDGTRLVVVVVTVCVAAVKVADLIGGKPTPEVWRAVVRGKQSRGGVVHSTKWASSEMQGWRPAMEDATCVVDSLLQPLERCALFAVFDGHGGAQVSQIASVEFPKVLVDCAKGLAEAPEPDAAAGEDARANDEPATEADDRPSAEQAEKEKKAGALEAAGEKQPTLARRSLHQAMMRMDASLRERGGGGKGTGGKGTNPPGLEGMPGKDMSSFADRHDFALTGSTAIVVLMDFGVDGGVPKRLTVANCGDSRAVLCRAGKALELSQDHKPELPEEEERIRKAGGHVAAAGLCHRIDGWGLNLSRALGDFHYKARSDLPPERQKVSCVPEIRCLELTEADEFLVLGCDGIFELHSSQSAVDVVRKSLRSGLSVAEATELLVDRSCSPNLVATRGRGGDNCSAIVVRLR